MVDSRCRVIVLYFMGCWLIHWVCLVVRCRFWQFIKHFNRNRFSRCILILNFWCSSYRSLGHLVMDCRLRVIIHHLMNLHLILLWIRLDMKSSLWDLIFHFNCDGFSWCVLILNFWCSSYRPLSHQMMKCRLRVIIGYLINNRFIIIWIHLDMKSCFWGLIFHFNCDGFSGCVLLLDFRYSS